MANVRIKEFDDDLWALAKAEAALRKVTVKAFVTYALAEYTQSLRSERKNQD